MTPREKLIEKVALKMQEAYDKYHGLETQEAFIKGIKDTCFYSQAQAIIDLLKPKRRNK